MNRARLALLAGLLLAGGVALRAFTPKQRAAKPFARVFDRRCRGGCSSSALLSFLPGGAVPSQWLATGAAISTAQGQAVTVSRASNKTCSTGASQDAAQLLVDPEKVGSSNWEVTSNTSNPVVTLATTETAGPDGRLDATKAVYPAVGSPNFYSTVRQSVTTGAGVATFSAYLRVPSGTATVYLDKQDVGNDAAQACSVTATWTRCVLANVPVSAGSHKFGIGVDTFNQTAGESAQPAQTIYVDDAKLELAASATAYSFTGQNNQAVRTLGTNTACVEPAGLSVEPSATNLLLQSSLAATWGASAGSTLTPAAAIGPDGATSGARITTSTAGHLVSQTVTVSASTQYVFSFYAKNNGGTVAAYSVYDLTHAADIVSSTQYVSQLNGTSYKRISVPFTTPAGCTSVTVYVMRDAGAGADLFVTGTQLETGTFATSLIPTTGTAATRAADVVQTASAYPIGAKPSFSADFTVNAAATNDGNTRFIVGPNVGANDRWDLYVASTGTLICDYSNGTGFQAIAGSVTPNVQHHALCSYDGTNLKVCLDGVCNSALQTFTASSTSYTIGLGSDLNPAGTYLQGNVANVCAAATPTGCK